MKKRIDNNFTQKLFDDTRIKYFSTSQKNYKQIIFKVAYRMYIKQMKQIKVSFLNFVKQIFVYKVIYLFTKTFHFSSFPLKKYLFYRMVNTLHMDAIQRIMNISKRTVIIKLWQTYQRHSLFSLVFSSHRLQVCTNFCIQHFHH